MTCYFGCAHDIFPRFGRNTSNRKILKVTKFRSPTGYEKKVIPKKPTGGAQCAPPPPPPVGIGLMLTCNNI